MNLMVSGIFMMEKRKQIYHVGMNKKPTNIRMYVGTTNEIKQKARKRNNDYGI